MKDQKSLRSPSSPSIAVSATAALLVALSAMLWGAACSSDNDSKKGSGSPSNSAQVKPNQQSAVLPPMQMMGACINPYPLNDPKIAPLGPGFKWADGSSTYYRLRRASVFQRDELNHATLFAETIVTTDTPGVIIPQPVLARKCADVSMQTLYEAVIDDRFPLEISRADGTFEQTLGIAFEAQYQAGLVVNYLPHNETGALIALEALQSNRLRFDGLVRETDGIEVVTRFYQPERDQIEVRMQLTNASASGVPGPRFERDISLLYVSNAFRHFF